LSKGCIVLRAALRDLKKEKQPLTFGPLRDDKLRMDGVLQINGASPA
jgi:hypothetical protein